MKVGRNDLCPCGSGRKYKKCCMFKGALSSAKSNTGLSGAQVIRSLCGEGEDDDVDRAVLLANMRNKLHKFLLKDKPHIKMYLKLRKMHSKILDGMMDYYHTDKFEQKVNNAFMSQNTLGNKTKDNTAILFESYFDLDTNLGNQAFADRMVYKNFPNMPCITEEFIKTNRYRIPEKIEFLHSMLEAKLGLFETINVDSKEGYAYLKEVFTGKEYKITDIGLSGSCSYTNLYLYTRIVTYRDISFSSGLNLAFSKKDPFIQEFIKKQKANYNPLHDVARFTELYNQFVNDPNGIKVTRNSFQ